MHAASTHQIIDILHSNDKGHLSKLASQNEIKGKY